MCSELSLSCSPYICGHFLRVGPLVISSSYSQLRDLCTSNLPPVTVAQSDTVSVCKSALKSQLQRNTTTSKWQWNPLSMRGLTNHGDFAADLFLPNWAHGNWTHVTRTYCRLCWKTLSRRKLQQKTGKWNSSNLKNKSWRHMLWQQRTESVSVINVNVTLLLAAHCSAHVDSFILSFDSFQRQFLHLWFHKVFLQLHTVNYYNQWQVLGKNCCNPCSFYRG